MHMADRGDRPLPGIVVYGAGSHAKVLAQSLRRAGQWCVAGFIDDVAPQRAGESFGGAVVLGGRAALASMRQRGVEAVVLAFGNNRARLALAAELADEGWQFPAVVDSDARLADDVRLDDGCFVAAGAIVESGVIIGAQTIVNSAAVVCHDSSIGAGVHLCPRVCLGGHAQVGDGAWIGIGSIVRDRVFVGANALVGAGSLVLRDVPQGMVVFGHPARVIREVSR